MPSNAFASSRKESISCDETSPISTAVEMTSSINVVIDASIWVESELSPTVVYSNTHSCERQ